MFCLFSLGRYCRYYKLSTQENMSLLSQVPELQQIMWYVLDEVGSRIQHSDEPTGIQTIYIYECDYYYVKFLLGIYKINKQSQLFEEIIFPNNFHLRFYSYQVHIFFSGQRPIQTMHESFKLNQSVLNFWRMRTVGFHAGFDLSAQSISGYIRGIIQGVCIYSVFRGRH